MRLHLGCVAVAEVNVYFADRTQLVSDDESGNDDTRLSTASRSATPG